MNLKVNYASKYKLIKSKVSDTYKYKENQHY